MHTQKKLRMDGLFSCCNSLSDAAFMLGACLCPCNAHVQNYALGLQTPEADSTTGCLAGMLTSCFWYVPLNADCWYRSCRHVFDFSDTAELEYSPTCVYQQLAACLAPRCWEITHRTALYPDEGFCTSCLKATCCWGCSLAQVNRELVRRRAQRQPPLEGNALLGLLYAPHQMENI
jgi:hypothetical protein